MKGCRRQKHSLPLLQYHKIQNYLLFHFSVKSTDCFYQGHFIQKDRSLPSQSTRILRTNLFTAYFNNLCIKHFLKANKFNFLPGMGYGLAMITLFNNKLTQSVFLIKITPDGAINPR